MNAVRKGTYKTAVPVTLTTVAGDTVECTAMVDSGNLWCNVINVRLLHHLGYDINDLEPLPGRKACGTAKEGAEMKVLGRLRQPIRLQLGDHRTKFRDRPVVLDGLSMSMNISGTFLQQHHIDQLHSKGMLRVQGHEIPLVSVMYDALAACQEPDRRVIVKQDVNVPPHSEAHVLASVGPGLDGQDLLVDGGGNFMRRTDLHPWKSALIRVGENGRCTVGVLNTTDYPVQIRAQTCYGLAALTTTVGAREHHDQRLCVLQSEDDVDGDEPSPPDPVVSEKKEESLPSWMSGPTNDQNRKQRLQHLIEYFKLNESPCLRKSEDVFQAACLLLKYWSLFSFDGSFGTTSLVKHEIKLKEGMDRPINMPYRPINPALEDDLRRQLDKWLRHRVIERSNSPYNFALVAAPKRGPDGKKSAIRWCVDYRRLNAATVPSTTPIGSIEDNLSKLSRSTVFSGIDGAGAFHVIPLADEDKEKTSFATPFGSFQFRNLPFGLCNGPSTYARLVNLVLDGIPYSVALPYLDDTVVHSATLRQHYTHLDRVLAAMKKGGLKLQPGKCQLFRDRIQYLGHEVSAEGIQPVPDYVKVVEEWPMPTTRTAVRAFLGKIGYYRRFIKDYASIAAPLYDLLKYPENVEDKSKAKLDKEEIPVTPAMEKSFSKLKKCLISAPILAYPDFRSSSPFILDTDWSKDNNAVGGVLSQVQDGRERVIAYGAKKLSPSQANYSATKGELAGVIIFMNKWAYYLRHRPFVLRTDHAALKWIHTMQAPSGMDQRWIDCLANHDFTVEHRAGTKHANADALSRAPHLQHENDTDISEGECHFIASLDHWWERSIHLVDDDAAAEEHWTPEFLVEQQQHDEEMRLIIDHLRDEEPLSHEEKISLSRTGRVWAGLMPNLKIDRKGLLRYKIPIAAGEEQRHPVLLPPTRWAEAAKRAHEEITHMGVLATVERLRKHFFFPGMFKEVTEVIQCCLVCQRRQGKQADQRHTLFSSLDGYPFKRLSIDFVGPLPR